MKKENFVTLVMSTIGGLIFALGMSGMEHFQAGYRMRCSRRSSSDSNGNRPQKNDRSITHTVERKNNRYYSLQCILNTGTRCRYVYGNGLGRSHDLGDYCRHSRYRSFTRTDSND